MPGSSRSRIRRPAFLVALLVSAAAYAYSLLGIAATGDELRSAVEAQSAKRAVAASYNAWDTGGGCPDSAEPAPSVRPPSVRL
jgi:lipopolysaccharide export LptBFGC system permease protein LptF